MKQFAALSGFAALAAAAPFYPSRYPAPSGALPPKPHGPHPTSPLYPLPTGIPPPPPSGSGFPMPTGSGFPLPSGTGVFPIGPVGTGTGLPFPMPTMTGTGPALPIGTAPPPYKREAQMESISFPSLSLPTGGFGDGSGIAAPTGMPSISFPTGGLGGVSAAPTGMPGFGSGSGSLPSLSLSSGIATPTGSIGDARGYQGKISTGSTETEGEEVQQESEVEE